ncbi:hypothetical protein, partial [Actinocorallia lasiicapitis]
MSRSTHPGTQFGDQVGGDVLGVEPEPGGGAGDLAGHLGGTEPRDLPGGGVGGGDPALDEAEMVAVDRGVDDQVGEGDLLLQGVADGRGAAVAEQVGGV